MAHKCRYCQTYLKSQDLYMVIINDRRTYFCNEEHYNLFIEKKENEQKQKEERKIEAKYKEECYFIICEIFDKKDIINTALWKEWKEWTKVASGEIIKQYLLDNKSFLHDSISKVTNGEFMKIRYLSAILKNNLSDYTNNETTVSEPTKNENDKKVIHGLQAKYSDLSMFTNAYINMYLDPFNRWDTSILIEDALSFILVANILNEDEITRHIISMSYGDFLCTPYWKAISDYVKQKFDCTCRLCKTKDNLNVHHKTYDNHGYEHKMTVIETDLTVLCRDCHKKIHSIK